MRWTFAVAITIATMYSVSNLRNHQKLTNFLVNYSTTFLQQAKEEVEELQSSMAPEGWSDVKLLVYMTTHLPDSHTAFYRVGRMPLND